MRKSWKTLSALGTAVLAIGTLSAAHTPDPTPSPEPNSTSSYPWHTRIPATTFWVGEIFDPTAPDGSQMFSTYDSDWFAHYGGCDGVNNGTGVKKCQTERRTAANGYFPTAMKPRENPFYLDLPFDDVNNRAAFNARGTVVPWANEYTAAQLKNPKVSLMKNRWVQIKKGDRVCYGQIEDAGPGEYNDSTYVFGTNDARPENKRYGAAGMDVSPALNGCLGFASLDGTGDLVDWRFIREADVPPGPWKQIITRSPVNNR